MLVPHRFAIRNVAIFVTLVCATGSAAAQSDDIAGAEQKLGPQPRQSGAIQTPIRRLAATGITTGVAAADVTSKHGITIGQTFAPWGTLVTVPVSQASKMERGKCAFRLSYDMINQSQVAAVLFKNTLSAGPSIVSTNDSLVLHGLQGKQVNTLAWLSPGTYDLILRLDAGNSVPESNENNNVMRVRLTLDGKCQGQLGAQIPTVPGDEKAHVPFLPPGTPNTADQTNEKPAPRFAPPQPQTPHAAEFGHGGPDTKSANGAFIIYGRRALVQRLGAAASAIIINDDRGVLTLTGKVPTPQAKAAAEQAVRSVPGVTDVHNDLVVAR
jgi:hypothetical protein